MSQEIAAGVVVESGWFTDRARFAGSELVWKEQKHKL
jgi:hypothetical protein